MKLKNKSVENVTWFLGELHAGGTEFIEGDDFDVVCDDDAFCTVSITDLAEDSKLIIESQHSDLCKANERIEELESKLRELCSVSESVFSDDIVNWVENNADEIKQLLDDK